MQTKEWDEHYHSLKFLQWWPNEAIVRSILREFSQNKISNLAKILDFGCGNGRHIRFLLENSKRMNNNIHVDGIDISKNAIKLAKEFLTNTFDKSTFTVNVYDGKIVPFDQNYFDYVISVAVLDQLKLDNAINLSNQINRVLKPSGKFFVDLEYITEDKQKSDLLEIGKLVEDNTVLITQGCEKNIFQHFFSNNDLKKLFNNWSSYHISEKNTSHVFSKSGELIRESIRCLIVAEK